MTLRNALVVALAVCLFGSGWLVEGWRKDGEIARLQGVQALAEAQAEKANAKRLAEASSRGDRLALQLAGTQETLTAFAEEKTREIARLTSGRRCLDGAVIRLLNQPAGLKLGGVVPQTAGFVVRPNGAAAAGSDDGAAQDEFATDADVAGWINLCRARYDTCRSRLQSLADFYQEEDQ